MMNTPRTCRLRRTLLFGVATAIAAGSSGIADTLRPLAASTPRLPVGSTTLLDPGTCAISGWARQPGYSGSIDVHVYTGGPVGVGGTFQAAIHANLPSDDQRGDGYEYIFPSGFSNSVYIYAIGTDNKGNPTGLNPLLDITSSSRQLTCATPSTGEGSQTVTLSSLGLTVTLGQVAPMMQVGEKGIAGAAPDTHMSDVVTSVGTETFFSCYGSTQLSCASRNTDIDHFTDLSGLITDSSTGNFHSVMPGRIPGDPYESDYAAIGATWQDPSTGVISAWYQGEVPVPGCTNGAKYATILYATSADGGNNFTKQGLALTSPDGNVSGNCFEEGVSEPQVVAFGNYLYMFFDYVHGTALGGTGIARAPMSSPNAWSKWLNGGYTGAATGGQLTPIIDNSVGGNGGHWAGAVIWNPAVGKWIMLNTDYSDEGAIYVRTSPDIINWTLQARLVVAPPSAGYRYPVLFGKDSSTMGASGWMYFARTPQGSSPGIPSLMARRAITFSVG